MSTEPTILEVIDSLVARKLEGVHVAMPGTIVSYDAATQRATVKPAVKQPRLDTETGEIVYVAFEPLKDVPVAWHRVGQAAMHGDLLPGQRVELVFHTQGIGEWRQGAEVGEPKDTRRHSFGYPVAHPCLYPDTEPLQSPGAGFTIGYQGAGHLGRIQMAPNYVQIGVGAGQQLALAPGTVAAIDAIVTALNAVQAALASAGARPATSGVSAAQATAVTTAIGLISSATIPANVAKGV